MNKKKIFVSIMLAVVLLTGCGAVKSEETTPQEDSTMLSKDKTYSVLFVGNSYTFYNDMPTVYFENMAKA